MSAGVGVAVAEVVGYCDMRPMRALTVNGCRTLLDRGGVRRGIRRVG